MKFPRLHLLSWPALCLGLALGGAGTASGVEPAHPAPAASSASRDSTPEQPLPASELSPQALYQFLLAEIAAGQGQFALSAQLYIELARATRDPRVARRAAELSMYSRNPHNISEAAQLWADTAPDSEDARRLLASVSGASGNLEQIQLQLARALAQSNGRLGPNLLGLNRTLASLENKQEALDIILRLTDPYLEHPEAHAARAQAAMLAEDAMQALGAIETALRLKPGWEPAIQLKVQILQHNGANDEAVRQLETELARQPASSGLRLSYARALVSARRIEDARTQFSQLLAAQPEDPELLYAVGLLSAQLKDYAAAEANLEQALTIGHPQPDLVRLQLGQIAEQRGEAASARKWFNQVGAGDYHTEAIIRSALSLAGEGEHEAALALLRVQDEDAGDDHRFLLAQTQVLRQAGRDQEAYERIETALHEAPDDTALLYELALLAERTGRDDEMEAHLRRVIELDPEHAHAFNALGYAFAERNIRLDEAESLLDEALRLSPDDPFILDSAGWLHFRRGQLEQALEYLERAYQSRQDSEIAAHLGEVLWQLERKDEAQRIFDEGLRKDPDNDLLQRTIQRLQGQ